ncbi:MAG: thiol peroxidase [Phycisphaerae bacterium]|nr:thiol peroxidase [Phycisphaerae bacterium]
MTQNITMKGSPLTVVGVVPEVGQDCPDCTFVSNDLSPVRLSDYAGKICIITSVPSLDTGVCDTMTRKFNEEASDLGDAVTVLTVSMDLPFAQKRWCGAAGVKNVVTLSDYRNAEFGEKFGVLIKELRLLARAIFIVDKQGKIRYKQLVQEQTNEPDYAEVIKAVKKLL